MSLLPEGGGEKLGLRVRQGYGAIRELWAQGLWKLAWESLAGLGTPWESLTKCREHGWSRTVWFTRSFPAVLGSPHLTLGVPAE